MPFRHLSFCAAFGLIAALSSPSLATTAEASPSLVLVTIDTLRADRLGCYGYARDTSPNLDAFAEESILFERTYTPMATTLPAHSSMMTGTYPLTHRVQANVAFLPHSLEDAASLRTLAEILQAEGYETAAFVSAAPLKRHSGIDRGFEVFSQPSMWQRVGARTTERALKWFDERSRERPFFLWVHYFDPHWPYSPPKEYRDLFEDTSELVRYLEKIGMPDSKSQKIIKINNAYDAEIRYTDTVVGHLFDRLKKSGVWKDAVVVVTSDHGEGLGQHDWLAHGGVYREQLRVPLMIKLPGTHPSRRVSRVTSLVDLLPILTAATRLPIPQDMLAQFQGVDVLNAPADHARVLSERVHRKRQAGERGQKYALTEANWKYVHAPEEDGDSLYDLRRDPHEMRNVIELYPEIASRLLATLSELIKTHGTKGHGTRADIDPETLEQLRSLGYVD